MPRITSLDDLGQLRDAVLRNRQQQAERGIARVTVGLGTCGIAAGALDVFRALQGGIETRHLKNLVLGQTGCLGLCSHEPILEVTIGTAPKISYGHVNPVVALRILDEHILKGKVVEEFVIDATPFPTI